MVIKCTPAMSALSLTWEYVYNAFGQNDFILLTFGKSIASYLSSWIETGHRPLQDQY